jgi:hypothetical protein
MPSQRTGYLLVLPLVAASCSGNIDEPGALQSSSQPRRSQPMDAGVTRDVAPPPVTGNATRAADSGTPERDAGTPATTPTTTPTTRPAAGGSGGSAAAGTGEAGSAGEAAEPPAGASYTVTGSWPKRALAVQQKPGKLTYKKLTIDDRFLAESCSIADYNRDGTPDISAGRRWYEGPFGDGGAAKEHVFRRGHDALPNTGAEAELYTGVSDDWACYAEDVDADGYTDIINIACPDVDESMTVSPATRQRSGTAVWYKNPGQTVASSDALWEAHPIHDDVRGEQHGLSDVDGDGRPEFYGACKACGNTSSSTYTRGYFQMDTTDPTAEWTYHAVTKPYSWPGGGWLHGFGFGDIDRDGQIDLLERAGIWTNIRAAQPDTNAYYDVRLYGEGTDAKDGGSHMFATDVDGDGDMDIITADMAHGYGVSWYEQTAPGELSKHQIVREEFSQPHAMEVVDMDGDGVSDIVTGKSYLAHPEGLDDPDLRGDPVNYVFKTKREAGSVVFERHPIDTSDNKVGIGRQVAVGHVDTDGILDICIASKLGVYVFLGQ